MLNKREKTYDFYYEIVPGIYEFHGEQQYQAYNDEASSHRLIIVIFYVVDYVMRKKIQEISL